MTKSVATEFSIEQKHFDALQQGALILCPNHRINVQVLEAYGLYRKKQGLSLICPSPAIVPVDIWIQETANNLLGSSAGDFSKQVILSPFQELFLWKKIISESESGALLLNIEGTAATVQEAYRLVQQWQIPLEALQQFSNQYFADSNRPEDSQAFLQWCQQYEQYAQDKNIVSLSQVLKQLIEAIEQTLFKLPNTIIFLGFDQPPPLYKNLLNVLQQQTTLEFHALPTYQPDIALKVFTNPQQEMLAAAKWAKNIVDSKRTARVAIVCPDLQTQKKSMQRIFNHCFSSEALLEDSYQPSILFSSTASDGLDNQPLIQTILMLLKLNDKTLPTLELCQILRCPFLVEATEEENSRALLENRLRKNTELHCRVSTLKVYCLDNEKDYFCPSLGQALLAFEGLQRTGNKSKSIEQWSLVMEQQVEIMLHLSTNQKIETKQKLQWYELIKSFKLLSFLSKPISYLSALQLLAQLARKTKANVFFNQAAVQILTPVEAIGLQYSHLWFMGLSENQWPTSHKSNPFLPAKLQIQYSLPSSTAELHYQQAKDLLQGAYQSTQQNLVLSYPLQVDEIERKPSLLIQELIAELDVTNETITDTLDVMHPQTLALYAQAKQDSMLESINESLHIPLLTDQHSSGGSSLLADQADCPFRSFAKHRLNAKELARPTFGLPAFAIGNMLHQALEIFWQGLKTQSNLRALDVEDKQNLINESVKVSVQSLANQYRQTMTSTYCELETKRLSLLLMQWLDEELKRGSFEILEQEFSLQWQFKQLNLNLRIDRVEKLEDGKIGLVDYKSSSHNTVAWFDERITNPQLLMYLQAAEDNENFEQVSSIFFAQVVIKDKDRIFTGLAENDSYYPKTAFNKHRQYPDSFTWDSLKQHWQDSLQDLAQEFIDGYLFISPYSAASCNYCHLDALCRIKEKGQAL